VAAQYNRTGTLIAYEDWKGYESDQRKHHVSPVARDVWLYDTQTRQHRRLTSHGGEDRNPVWAPDEQALYYLSEQSGSFNVWKMPLGQPDAAVQVTRFTKNPVRFLSIASNGLLSFGYDGELYTLAPGAAEPAKVAVQIAADIRAQRVENVKLTEGATEIAVSPDGEEIAFIVRGEVFVASTEFGDTRRITDTPEQERSVSFSPDGRRLVFAGEHDGSWNLYEATLPGKKKDNPHFYGAAQVQLKTLLKNGAENFQPRWSPDGKEVAYLENRTTLKVLTLATGKTRVVMAGHHNYSYLDGDQWFDWSPDGQALLVNFIDRNRWSAEVGLVDAQGKGTLVNLTQSGYEDLKPMWTTGGKAMLWVSDRMGLHGTGGAAQQDLFAMFFTQDAYDRFKLEKSEYALLKQQEDGDGDDDEDDGKSKPKEKPEGKDKARVRDEQRARDEAARPPEPVKIEREGLEDRVERLTANSAPLRAMAMAPDGETLLYVVQTADAAELWINRLRAKESKRAASFPLEEGGDETPLDLQLDAKGDNGFVLVGGKIQKFKLPKEDGEIKPEGLDFSADMRLDRAAERAHMFEHVWRQTREKLYVADMDGVDWAGYRKVYEKHLPYVTNNHDFAELISEMLGELNVSHTGAGYRPSIKDGDATAALGLFYDEAHTGPGVKVAEVIAGGPLAGAKSAVKPGMVIERIDGVAIGAGAEFDSVLNQKAGKRIALAVHDPATGKRFEQTVKPIALAEQNELLYRRWVKAQRALVDKLSGGRLGYVHVRGMDDESYRDVFSEVMGRHSGKEGLVVDTRFNGGGNLTEDLATLLSGKRYLEMIPRGQSLGWEPTGKWSKPSVVLMSESNYSDAHLFPWAYRFKGLGKLVGMPVAGTGTAVWWETLQDDTLHFGIPEVGFRDAKGEYMEKALVEPDVLVRNDPAQIATGRDQQLEAAVKVLLGGQ
jgi:tricorn protease